ncbi:protein-L-isoaspartate O-methyltransferase [Halobacteriales archaeon QS_1_68_20]|nr:MAG: protein-L-isoaspartate O-methyltransferase [Halobacteriales archaeon QS_1_68_20]
MFGGDGDTDVEDARRRLVERLQRQGRLGDGAVADAMRAVPRHEFVPEGRQDDAYADRPLPIGQGQTISAPHMVATMVDLLDAERGDEVLEIGTGCGYHAAVTAEVVGPENLYTVEYHAALADSARDTLADLGYGEVHVRVGDGHEGWPEHAHYDAAYLTAAPAAIPPKVVEQVRPGGVVLAPVGEGRQRLVRTTVGDDGIVDREDHGGVRFVRMQGD